MKKYLLLLLLGILIQNADAQDLIVTNKGDSLNCKITKVKADFVYFTFKYEDEIRNTLLKKSSIKDYQIDFFTEPEVPADKLKNNFKGDYPRFRIAVSGGFSRQTGKISDKLNSSLKKHIEGLKNGMHFGAEITYYFSESIGVGVRGRTFNTKNESNSITIESANGTITTPLKDDLTISFVGPVVSTRMFSKEKKNAFYSSFSFGHLGYFNNETLSRDFEITGSTFGFGIELGYDVGLSDNLAFGFELSLVSGWLREMKISDGNRSETIKLQKGNYESMSRFDISIGLRLIK